MLTCATPYERPIDPGLEHNLFKVRISRALSEGAGSCDGCAEGACLVLNRIVINQPAGAGDATITTPLVRNWVTYANAAGLPDPYLYGCTGSVLARRRSWGQVKAMYR